MMMAPGDPALFRLRVFENSWVRPIENNPAFATLSPILMMEVRRWFAAGRQIGYFDEAAEFDVAEPAPYVDEEVFFIDREPPNAIVFGHALSNAREDLTPQRVECARLLIFATEDEWDQELGLVRNLAETLQRQPWLSVPSTYVERIAWSLDGAEPAVRRTPYPRIVGDRSRKAVPRFASPERIQARRRELAERRARYAVARWAYNSPAAWRTTLPRTRAGLPDIPSVVERSRSLEETRSPIMRAMEWMAQGDPASAPSRFAVERGLRAEFDEERPLWGRGYSSTDE